MSKPHLQASNLACVRDGRWLFRELHLELGPGRALQVEGANGAGKTSLLRILCGLTPPRAGEVRWRGLDIRRCREDYHASLLYLGHQPGLKDELTALENLRFAHALHGHTHEEQALEAALDQVGLYGYEDVPVRALSAGQRRRVALARLWLNRAPLWVLDEPFTAIDRRGIVALEQVMAGHLGRGGLLILTSHQPVELPGMTLERLELAA
ncbi:MAG TPA: cytochrome c biogenesis heme-transporting ATPase CcmA [Candidatus Competibacteraceae bacterium]|nr:cytochrome c biogenesis heme-transporting ATPase CcmA [Candidatus Competibacteraceae bacterium]